jgi:hypothetical protein
LRNRKVRPLQSLDRPGPTTDVVGMLKVQTGTDVDAPVETGESAALDA